MLTKIHIAIKKHDTRTIIEIMNSKSSFKASQEDLSDMLNKLKSCVNINDLPFIKNENGEFVGFEMLQKNISKEKGKLSKLARKIDYQNTPKIFTQKNSFHNPDMIMSHKIDKLLL